MTRRFNIVTDVPKQLRDRGFVAYVTDALHPDRASDDSPLSVSWHTSLEDAHRVCRALELMSCNDKEAPGMRRYWRERR